MRRRFSCRASQACGPGSAPTECQRDGENGLVTVNDIVTEQERDVQTRLVHGQRLALWLADLAQSIWHASESRIRTRACAEVVVGLTTYGPSVIIGVGRLGPVGDVVVFIDRELQGGARNSARPAPPSARRSLNRLRLFCANARWPAAKSGRLGRYDISDGNRVLVLAAAAVIIGCDDETT